MGNLRIAVGLTLVLLGATFGASADQDEVSRSALVIRAAGDGYTGRDGFSMRRFRMGSGSLWRPSRGTAKA